MNLLNATVSLAATIQKLPNALHNSPQNVLCTTALAQVVLF